MKGEALLFDGHSLLHRHFHALGYALTSPSGEMTKATYGTVAEVIRLVKARAPEYVAFAVDTPREQLWRRALYSGYKAARGPSKEGFSQQLRRTKELLRALGVPVLEVPTQEADDVLATLVENLPEGTPAVLVTGDKDLAQLVSPHVSMVRDSRLWTTRDVVGKYGIHPRRFLDYLTLAGDSADNVPGVKGIGHTHAYDLVHSYPSIRAMYTGAGTSGPRSLVAKAVADGSLSLSRRLVSLDSEVVGLPGHNRLRFQGFDWRNARPILDMLGIRTLN